MSDELCEMSCGSEVVEVKLELEEKEEEPGVSEQKQKPHTKMWGTTTSKCFRNTMPHLDFIVNVKF